MSSAKRFSFLRNTVRTHPIILATSAATAGVLLGGFVTVQLLATPQLQGPRSPQAIAESKAVSKPVAETTGSAPSGEIVASSNCGQQTWPNLSRDCIEEYRNKNRAARVVLTDRNNRQETTAAEVVQPAPRADDSNLAAPAGWSPTVASTTAPVVTPSMQTVSVSESANATPAPEATAPAPAEAQTAVKSDPRPVKKAKRKPKTGPKTPVELDDQDGSNTFTSLDIEDGAPDIRSGRRSDRRRIVERWTERDYDVPNSMGEGRRRVTVIRRGDSGPFGSIFGMRDGD